MLLHYLTGGITMERYLISAALAALIFTFAFCYSSPAGAYNSQTCGGYNAEMFELSGLSTIALDQMEYEFNEAKGALAQSACKDLKPDYCSMGACENGWKCKANVNDCMCFPPD